MTDTPMTVAEARSRADKCDEFIWVESRTSAKRSYAKEAATLRAYADMLDRKAPDDVREALLWTIQKIYDDGYYKVREGKSLRKKSNDDYADAILALIQPAAPDGMVMVPKKDLNTWRDALWQQADEISNDLGAHVQEGGNGKATDAERKVLSAAGSISRAMLSAAPTEGGE